MTIHYYTGEVIMKGDRVRLHDEPGEIEFVAEMPIGDPLVDWNLSQNGPGVMVRVFGSLYLRDTEQREDLKFVSRASG
jgi:hypothetical protein